MVMAMIYKNAWIISRDKMFLGYLELDDRGRIVTIKEGSTSFPGYDCRNKFLLPGFIDSHTHGGYNWDFNDFVRPRYDMNLLRGYLLQLGREGVVGVMGTSVTLPLSGLTVLLQNFIDFFSTKKNNQFNNCAQLLGWYFEGPFISVVKKGAHDSKLICELDENFLKLLLKAKEKIHCPLVVAFAAEFAQNITLVEKFQHEFLFALGHSNATFAQTQTAFDAGAKRIVHFYNAMSGFSHRQMGIVNAVLQGHYPSNLLIEFISDGVHTTNEVIKFTSQSLGYNNLSLVSDSLSPKGCMDGDYFLANIPVEKRGNWFYIKNTDQLSGSGCPYLEVAKNFKKITQCTWPELVKVTSYNSAQNLQLPNNYGQLTLNMPANLIMLDDDFNLYLTVADGKVIYNNIVTF